VIGGVKTLLFSFYFLYFLWKFFFVDGFSNDAISRGDFLCDFCFCGLTRLFGFELCNTFDNCLSKSYSLLLGVASAR